MSKKVSCRKGFTGVKGKVKMVIMDTILCGMWKGFTISVWPYILHIKQKKVGPSGLSLKRKNFISRAWKACGKPVGKNPITSPFSTLTGIDW